MFTVLSEFVNLSILCAAGVVVLGLLLVALWKWIEYKSYEGEP